MPISPTTPPALSNFRIYDPGTDSETAYPAVTLAYEYNDVYIFDDPFGPTYIEQDKYIFVFQNLPAITWYSDLELRFTLDWTAWYDTESPGYIGGPTAHGGVQVEGLPLPSTGGGAGFDLPGGALYDTFKQDVAFTVASEQYVGTSLFLRRLDTELEDDTTHGVGTKFERAMWLRETSIVSDVETTVAGVVGIKAGSAGDLTTIVHRTAIPASTTGGILLDGQAYTETVSGGTIVKETIASDLSLVGAVPTILATQITTEADLAFAAQTPTVDVQQPITEADLSFGIDRVYTVKDQAYLRDWADYPVGEAPSDFTSIWQASDSSTIAVVSDIAGSYGKALSLTQLGTPAVGIRWDLPDDSGYTTGYAKASPRTCVWYNMREMTAGDRISAHGVYVTEGGAVYSVVYNGNAEPGPAFTFVGSLGYAVQYPEIVWQVAGLPLVGVRDTSLGHTAYTFYFMPVTLADGLSGAGFSAYNQSDRRVYEFGFYPVPDIDTAPSPTFYHLAPTTRATSPPTDMTGAQVGYIFKITGDRQGLPDLTVPISSLSLRRADRRGGSMNATIPAPSTDTVSGINARTEGQLVVYRRVTFPDGTVVDTEIGRNEWNRMDVFRGGSSSSITVSGTITENIPLPKIQELSYASAYAQQGGLKRYTAAVNDQIQPGDVADVDGDQYVVGRLTYTAGASGDSMEVIEYG